jgi:hypothetical protein
LAANKRIELVVLNGCRSADLAKQVAAAGVTAIGTTADLPDELGATFSAAFYAYFAKNKDIPQAFSAGRSGVLGNDSGLKELYVLYERGT